MTFATLPVTSYVKQASAIVDEPAEIGEGSCIGHFSHIAAGARIGCGCVIGQGVYVAPTVVIGAGVVIENGVSVYDGVIVEAYAFIGPGVVFTNVNNPRSEIPRLGKQVATRVGRGATVGANATIVCGVEIGSYSLIGAGAVVTAQVPPFALVVGVPARQRGWICRCGEQLSMESAAGYCTACGRGYRSDGRAISEA